MLNKLGIEYANDDVDESEFSEEELAR